mgnify:FL=1
MKRIYLTIDINVNDKYFDGLSNFDKLNIKDIIEDKRLTLDPFELENIRGEIVAERIRKNKENILIGFAIRTVEELKKILADSGDETENIYKIYLGGEGRRKAEIDRYKRDYSKHSRWLDYSPEYIENSYLEFDEKIAEVIKYAIGNKIEVVSI